MNDEESHVTRLNTTKISHFSLSYMLKTLKKDSPYRDHMRSIDFAEFYLKIILKMCCFEIIWGSHEIGY